VRALRGTTGIDKALKGLTFLASSSGRTPGNGDSYEPAFAKLRGRAVAFTSTAANLAGGDGNGQPDVYLRALNEVVVGKGKGPPNTVRSFRPTTRLVSATPQGRAGNGASRRPSSDGLGRFVYYDTTATDILPEDTNGASDVVRADTARGPSAAMMASRTSGQIGNGPSFAPIASTGGTNGIFLSAATNFEVSGRPFAKGDANGAVDMFIWTANRHRVFLQSRSSDEGPLSLPVTDIALSARTNYILMETAAPFADMNTIRAHHSAMLGNPRATVSQASADPSFVQIYLRYLGPE
jgi:hypothetical protein